MKPGPRPGKGKKWQTSITFDADLKPALQSLPNTSEFVNQAVRRELKRKLRPETREDQTP